MGEHLDSPEPAQDRSRDLPLGEACFCVLDLETTGFSARDDRVVEVAGAYVSLDHGITRHLGRLVNPQRAIPADATAIHGLRDEDVADAGTLDSALDALKGHPFDVWAAHNAAFDFGFVPAGDIPLICTMVLARRLWPELPEHKNQSLRAHWHLEVPEAEGLPAHRAEPDALVTAALLRLELKVVRERYPGLESIGQFLDWMNTPVLIPLCVVGRKHRGKPWSEVPKRDLQWYLDHFEDLDGDLLATLRHHLAH
jgi:DNA polymerase III epsilon subunit-like protein